MPTLAQNLAIQIDVAEPTVVGALAVFPLIANRAPSMRYVSFAEAVQQGASVKELANGASVNDLFVHNPLDMAVLLYEGEEVLGAQQTARSMSRRSWPPTVNSGSRSAALNRVGGTERATMRHSRRRRKPQIHGCAR